MRLVPSTRVAAVSKDQTHRFSKVPCDTIVLVEGLGVMGDSHAGMLGVTIRALCRCSIRLFLLDSPLS